MFAGFSVDGSDFTEGSGEESYPQGPVSSEAYVEIARDLPFVYPSTASSGRIDLAELTALCHPRGPGDARRTRFRFEATAEVLTYTGATSADMSDTPQ